jgi:hypothetical protein
VHEFATRKFHVASLRLDVRELHHLAPLLGLVPDDFGELGGRARQRRGAEFGKPRDKLRIDQGCVNLSVQLVDDLSD